MRHAHASFLRQHCRRDVAVGTGTGGTESSPLFCDFAYAMNPRMSLAGTAAFTTSTIGEFDHRQRRKVVDRVVVRGLPVQDRRDDEAAVHQHHRVTVRWRRGRGHRADSGRGARLVVDDHRLSEQFAQRPGEFSGHEVSAAAGRVRHDDPDRPVREVGLRRDRCGEESAQSDDGSSSRGESKRVATNLVHGGLSGCVAGANWAAMSLRLVASSRSNSASTTARRDTSVRAAAKSLALDVTSAATTAPSRR